MQFTIGTIAYQVRVSPRRLFNDQAEELWGVCDPLHREIVLSPELPAERRAKVLRHEVWHQWCQQTNTPADEESQATLFATASESLDEQLQAQGGPAALEGLQPAERHSPFVLPPANGITQETWLVDRKPCPVCQRSIMAGDIISGPPLYLREIRSWAMDRWAQCPACGTVQVWREACAEDGTPLSVIVQIPTPRLLQGEDARRFVAENTNGQRRLVACD